VRIRGSTFVPHNLFLAKLDRKALFLSKDLSETRHCMEPGAFLWRGDQFAIVMRMAFRPLREPGQRCHPPFRCGLIGAAVLRAAPPLVKKEYRYVFRRKVSRKRSAPWEIRLPHRRDFGARHERDGASFDASQTPCDACVLWL
jgi:hypothetical protein